ncbi:MAG: hypothetical protein AAFX10_07820 [Pseudomonadota bacterium]
MASSTSNLSTFWLRAGAIVIAMALVPAAAEQSKRKVNNEAEIRHTMALEPAHVGRACEARLELEYYQKGPEVHVDTVLSNSACAASSGSYVVEVRYRDSDGEIDSKLFDETWSRDDDQPVKASRDYAVADNVDVIRVRSRRLRCECAEPRDAE